VARRAAPAPAGGEERPPLSLVPAPEPAPTQAPATTPTQAPAQIARSAAERVADATGGAVEAGEGGLRTVHFPAPGGGPPAADLTRAPYTVTRAIDLPAVPATPAAQPTPPAQAPSTPAAGAPQPGGMDLEAAYEYFLDRFKRDLIIEREQSGHLLIDNP
jgi:hypothetical protein